jgi:C-terminal processing protease CtpA/Prc
MVSRSINKRNSDPMEIFGLKTTFKEPTAFKEKAIYQPDELTEDFEILKNALFEGYPGINDYFSKDSLLLLYNASILELEEPRTKQEFTSILKSFINPLLDDHLDLIDESVSNGSKITPVSDVIIGVQSDSLFILRTNNEYSHLLGKRIVSIDNIKEKQLIKSIRKTIPHKADGLNESRLDFDMLCSFWSFFDKYFNKDAGDSIKIEFSDGSAYHSTYKVRSIKEYKPYFYRKSSGKKPISTKILQDSIAYLDINTFSISEKTEQAILQFMKTLNDIGIHKLIIDLRNNPGGHETSLAKVFSSITQESFKTFISQKVTTNKPYEFAQYTDNLIREEVTFPEYAIEKEDGFYLPDSLLVTYQPHTTVNYTGEVFILTNAFTSSAASTFAALVKKYGRGIIVGQETGGAYYHLNALHFAKLRLPNTNINVLIPLIQIIFDLEKDSHNPWGRGVMPDIQIPLTSEELTNNKEDIFLTKALQQIQKYEHSKLINKPADKEISMQLIFIVMGLGFVIAIVLAFKMRK